MTITENIQKKVTSYLLEKGAKEVFLFGSQYSGTAGSQSDIDIGVRGLPPEMFFFAIYDLEDIADRKVDLVDFDLSERFYNHLLETNSVEKIGGVLVSRYGFTQE